MPASKLMHGKSKQHAFRTTTYSSSMSFRSCCHLARSKKSSAYAGQGTKHVSLLNRTNYVLHTTTHTILWSVGARLSRYEVLADAKDGSPVQFIVLWLGAKAPQLGPL